jgi:hypothetical protein
MSREKNELIIISTNSSPYNISYAEWTARWWQWLFSIPIENNPLMDETGKNCEINQSGPVWFLAGTAGGECKRECTIPAEKSVLFPVLNYGATFADEPTINTEEELQSLAKREMDIVSDLSVTFDGIKLNGLQKYRVQSPLFDVTLPERNLFGGIPGPTKGISDGYWLFLESVPTCKHIIRTDGSCLSGKVRIAANYDITME